MKILADILANNQEIEGKKLEAGIFVSMYEYKNLFKSYQYLIYQIISMDAMKKIGKNQKIPTQEKQRVFV